MQTTPYDLKPQPRWQTVDGALRFATWPRDTLRAFDPGAVNVGWDASRHSAAEVQEVRSRVLATLQALTERERVALIMRAHDYSFPQIGERIGASHTTAARLVKTARQKIGDRLRELHLVA